MKLTIAVFSSLVLSILCYSQSGAQGWKETLAAADSLAERHDYYSAIEIGHLALSRAESEFGEADTVVALVLYNLASKCSSARRYLESQQLLLRCLKIFEHAFGPDHVRVASTLTKWAIVLLIQSRHAEAEPLLLRAQAIYEKEYGPENEFVINGMCNLGVLYKKQERYEEAEAVYKRGLEIAEKTQHPNMPNFVRNLGSLYEGQAKYSEAEFYYKRLINLNERLMGPEHWTTATSLQILAAMYRRQHRLEEAEPLLLRAVAINDKNFAPDYPLSTSVKNELANLYVETGKYAAAESLYVEVLNLRENAGAFQDWVVETIEQMSRMYRLDGNRPRALESARRACSIRLKDIRERVALSAEEDALVFSQAARYSVGNYLTCYLEAQPTDSLAVTGAANIILANKGLISDGIFERQRNIVRETDSVTVALSEAFKETKRRLSQLFISGLGQDLEGYRKAVDSLEGRATLIEADLSRRSYSYREHSAHGNITADRVASMLTDKDVLIEYLKYGYRLLRPDSSSPRYLAVVLAHSAEPVIIELGQSEEIDQLVHSYVNHIRYVAAAGAVATGSDNQEFTRITGEIYDRIWLPLEKHVVDKDLVLIAPDGALNTVSFATLRANDGHYLIEKYAVHYLSAARDLARLSDSADTGSGLLALGDPDYDAPVSSRLTEQAESGALASTSLPGLLDKLRSSCGILSDISLSPLPGSRHEISEVMKTWEETTPEPATACVGNRASEDVFKTEAPGKRAIHLATHGYSIGRECEEDTMQTRAASRPADADANPLLRSGLFLAGANLDGRGADSAGVEDGILTAYEVSAMDLTGTELVVLSACETGLGEVFSGEGVYGLRRAFQIAGAETVISTLWPVSDQLTANFCSDIYNRQGVSLPETIRRVQLEKINDLRRQGMADHPMAWGAFVAYGQWR